MPSASSFLDEPESASSFLDEESDDEVIPPPQRPITGATGTWEEAGDKPDWAALETEYNRRTYGPPSEPDLTLGQTIKQGLSEGMATAAESPIGLPAKAMAFVPRPTAQETQDVFDLISNPLNPGAPSRPPSEAAQALTGAVNVGRDVGEGLVSPIGVATLGMGAAPQTFRRLGELAFTADMLRQVPEQARRAGEASVTGDTQEKVEAFGGLGVTSAFVGGMGTAALRPTRPPELPRQTVAALEKGAEAGLSKSVAAAADVVVKEPPKPVAEPAAAQEVAPLTPPKGERLVTIEKPDGTTEQASFGDKYWEMEDQKLPSVARWIGDGWSHGMLREGERIVEAKPANTQNVITKETMPERVVVQAEQVLENGETVPGYVTIQSKGNAQSGPVEAWRAAGHEIPDVAGVPTGTYTVEQLRANEKSKTQTELGDSSVNKGSRTIPENTLEGVGAGASARTGSVEKPQGSVGAISGIANEKARTQTQPVPEGQTPVVEQGVGAVPENVPAARAETEAPGAGRGAGVADTIETAPLDPQSGAPIAPPAKPLLANARLAADRPIQEPYSNKHSVSLQVTATEFPNGSKEAVIQSLPKELADKVDSVRFFQGEVVPTNKGLSVPARVEITFKDRAGAQSAIDYFKPPAAPPSKPPSPPAPPTSGAPSAPTPPPPGGRATLEDVYQRFEPAPKERKGVKQVVGDTVEAFRTGFSSKFRPLNKLAEDVAKSVGAKAKDVAGIFEQLKGSSGKAEADVYRFDKEVSDAVKGSEKDFNAYMFLRRSLDRLKQDSADIDSAIAGKPVAKLNRRAVSDYTIPQLEAKLAALSEQIGGEKLTKFNDASESYQKHMDQALKLQVESGRMSPEVYDAIKAGNQFYAPFKVMKYIEETMRPEGTGRRVDTLAEFTKAMEGIEDPNFKLGDMLSAARQNLTMSRVLAEKNRAMQNITELAALDVDGNFVRKLKPGQDAPKGMEAVNVMENGVKERYAVNEDVAQAVQNVGPGMPAGIVARWASTVFRAGATTLNVAFQPVNLLFADAPRAALVSKYGVKGVTDLVRYPMDLVESLFSSIAADMGGYKSKLFQDYLDSGAAGTTIQQYLTPEALRFKADTTTSKTKAIAHTVLNTVPQFANAIEQTSKVLGVKRAMRLEGVESGAALAKQIPEAITEIRRFSGSPDFGRSGKWTDQYRLNMIYMFLNARIQGAVADVGRLTGRDGAGTAAKTWLKMGTAVGIPTAYLYMLNNSEEYKKDYEQRPEQEKQNYWLIPKDTFITGSNGEKIRDYWRVPKREIAQWMGNAVESGLDFANQRDPEAFWKWAEGMAESIAPVNIRGKTLQERGESVLSGTHPFIKAPIETFAGRDLYRHRDIVPDSQKKASPEQQFDERTPDVFKALADKMPDVAPEVFRSPKMLENMTRNFTAGLITQFLPRKPVDGRTATENNPLLQRFQALPYTDSTEFEERISKFERESADEQLKRLRDAQQILKDHPGSKPDVLIRDVVQKHGADRKLAERVVDLYQAEQRGITPQERRVLALPVAQRADYLAGELEGKTPEQKAALIRNWALKRLLTEQVVRELGERVK